MIEVGTRVRFVPEFLAMHVSGFAKEPFPVVGEVIFSNPEKEFFVAEFPIGCGVLREGFQYWDIGRRCTVLMAENRGDTHG
jgi:hypothetical protein